ncbi:MAG: flavodoxin family protein [Clostridia bacterium]|nr:flavodoxin family protein [Clostridia bacterium]
MAKNILVLAGSPRKGGNSDRLCDEFIRGAIKSGHYVEKIYINDMNIGACQACYACRGTGECFIKDDMADILDKMIKCDVIVMATPVYFYTMDGQMKTLIDRTLPRYTEIRDKEFYFIATAAAGESFMERTIDGFKGFTDCLDGAVIKGIVYGSNAWQKGDIINSPKMAEAYNMGLNV